MHCCKFFVRTKIFLFILFLLKVETIKTEKYLFNKRLFRFLILISHMLLDIYAGNDALTVVVSKQ